MLETFRLVKTPVVLLGEPVEIPLGEKMKNRNHKDFCTTVYYDKHIQLLNVPNRHGYNLALNLEKGG
jgi:hypothetical protein